MHVAVAVLPYIAITRAAAVCALYLFSYGKSIFGVDGTATLPSITQDSVTKVLSIS